ncbi:MAG: hypothetical protein JST62_14285 [Bacteroidetes bacterium]|nr:hypothetical protein [Bacteroidota bacterium]
MKKILTISLFSLLVFSCNKEDKKQSDFTNNHSQNNNTIQKFQSFSFPEDIQGCSCAFATDKTSFEKEQYIFVDDYGNSATIKWNDEFLKFPMEEGDFDPSHFERELKSNGYILKMKAQKLNEDPETMIFQGEMTITTPEGNTITSPIYGECGC